MDNLEDEIKQLQETLKSQREEIKTFSDLNDSEMTSVKELGKQEAQLASLLSDIRKKKQALQVKHNERLKALREARLTEDQLNRKLLKLSSDASDRARLNELSDKLDRETAGRPWREWAYDHQIKGAKHLASVRRAVLGDKRGLGKTLTSLIYLDMIKAKKALIFTPKDVSRNFESEIKHWTPDRPVIVMTSMTKGMRDAILMGLRVAPECTVILNYEAWRRDSSLVDRLIECQFDTIIIDEAHNIKNPKGIDFKGIRDITYAENKCPSCGSDKFEVSDRELHCANCLYRANEFGEYCSVKNVVPMTGTSIINRPQEFWPLAHLVDRVNFPDMYSFLRQYCMQKYDGSWGFLPGGSDRLLKSIGPKYIGRTPESAGVKFPPQIPQHHYVEFDVKAYPNQWRIMKQIQEENALMLNEEEDVALLVPAIIAVYTRLSQAITFPGGIKKYGTNAYGKPDYNNVIYTCDVTESIKIDEAMKIIEQGVGEDDRMVLFSRFKETLKELERRLNAAGISCVRYDGDISNKRAIEAQLDFDLKTAPNHSSEEPCIGPCNECDEGQCKHACPHWGEMCFGYKYQVFLGQYQKAGTGLNLNAARQMVILDRYYAWAYEDQASGRIQRLNSTQETVVHIITITSPIEGKFTIDEWMDNLVETKKEMGDSMDQSYFATELAKALKNGDLF